MTDTIQTTSQPEEVQKMGTKRPAVFAYPSYSCGSAFSLLALLGWALMRTNATRPEAGQPAPDRAGGSSLMDMNGKTNRLLICKTWPARWSYSILGFLVC